MFASGCGRKSKRRGKETRHLQGLYKPADIIICSCSALTPSVHVQGRKLLFFFQVKEEAWSSAVLQANSLATEPLSVNSVENHLVICWFFLPKTGSMLLCWRSPTRLSWSGRALFALGEERGEKASTGLKRMCGAPLAAGHITEK